MKLSRLIMALTLAFGSSLATAQDVERLPQGNDDQYGAFEMDKDVWSELEREDRDEGDRVRRHADADIIPAGWIDDFDYASPLNEYLVAKFNAASQAGKQTYVYLYADWLEPCREFRKTVERADYAELFEGSEVILLDYNYFARQFNTKIRNLPLLMKVHPKGVLGPEVLHPLSRKAEHPAKAFHRVKDFLLAGTENG